MRLHGSIAGVALALVVLPPALAAVDEAAESLLAEADEKLSRRDHDEAIRLFKQALKAAGNDCGACHMGLAQAYNAVGAHKNAITSAEEAISRLPEAHQQAAAWNQKALAQFALAEQDTGKLRAVETSLRRVLELSGEPMARFSLGVTLIRLGREEEGLAELQAFVEAAPNSQKARTARDMIEDPRRARQNMLPSLELVTLGGDYLTNEDLAGKVVLLDFWGTWCPPCRASVPSLRGLVERNAKLPLVVLSVSNDQDENALRSFVASNGMTWPQVWDRKQGLVREMNVSGFPTYILADHEGVIVFRYSGWGEPIERAIQAEIRRAVGRAKRAATN
jgi:thiol-disulfide isomerase/thioredoxin